MFGAFGWIKAAFFFPFQVNERSHLMKESKDRPAIAHVIVPLQRCKPHEGHHINIISYPKLPLLLTPNPLLTTSPLILTISPLLQKLIRPPHPSPPQPPPHTLTPPINLMISLFRPNHIKKRPDPDLWLLFDKHLFFFFFYAFFY